MLALSLEQELPWLAWPGMLAIFAAFLVALWRLIERRIAPRVERFIITPTGVKWEWVLIPVWTVAVFRFIESTVVQHDPSTLHGASMTLLRLFIFGLGNFSAQMGVRMAREKRLRRANEEGNSKPFDWHRDVEDNQVPLVLFALGLTLLQMS